MRKKILEGLNYGDYEISGQSLVYNNSLDIGGKFLANPNVTFTKENGIITITKEAGYIGTGNASSVYTKGIDAIVGDKYLFIAQIRTDTPNGIKAGGGYGGNYFTDVLVPTSSWETYGRIFTANSTSPYQYLYIYFSNASGVSVQYKNTAYINLTLLEQALGTTINTLDDFYATEVGQQVRKGLYLPYSATNTILNAEFPIRVVGENLFGNIQWKTGIYAYSEIEKPEFRLAISLKKGKTIPSDLYFGVNDTGDFQQGINAIWLVSEGNFIREVVSSIGFPHAKKYIAVYPPKYKDTITEYFDITLTEGTSPKPYVKYIDRTIDVGEPLQLRGVGDIHDTYRNTTGKKKTRVGEVDLGSFDYVYEDGRTRFYLQDYTKLNTLKAVGNTFTIPNFTCSILQSVSIIDFDSKLIDKSIRGHASLNGYIYIRDTDYTDTTSFKTAMSGVMLNYELATPTTDIYSSHALPKGITKAYDVHGMELYIKEK